MSEYDTDATLDVILAQTRLLARNPTDMIVTAQVCNEMYPHLNRLVISGFADIQGAVARLLESVGWIRLARVNLTVARQDRTAKNMSATKAVVAPWLDVYGASFIVECQIRLLLVDLAAACNISGTDKNVIAADLELPCSAIHRIEARNWNENTGVLTPVSMNVLKKDIQLIMGNWNASGDRMLALIKLLDRVSLTTVVRPIREDIYDVDDWVIRTETIEEHNDECTATSQPAPAFLRCFERASTLDGARTEMRSMVFQGETPPPIEAASSRTQTNKSNLHAWWQRFDVAHMTAALSVEIGESCTLEDRISPLDPYIMRNGLGGCPEENRLSPASWILSTLYTDEVRAVRDRCQDVLKNDVSLIEIFSYCVQQTCEFDFTTSCLVSDRQPFGALGKLRRLDMSNAVRPLPVIVQIDSIFALYQRNKSTKVYTTRLDVLTAWCEIILNDFNGIIGRKVSIKELILTVFSPQADAKTDESANVGRWKDVTAGRTVQL